MQDGPGSACGRGQSFTGEPDQQGETDEAGREGPGEHADRRRPEQAFAGHLEQDQKQRQHRERRRDADERRELREADHMGPHSEQRDRERERARGRPESGERRQDERGAHGV